MAEIDDVLDDFHFAVMKKRKLEKQNSDLVAVAKDVDRMFSKRQGLDYDYWSQEEKDLHDKARQALAQVGK